MPTRQPDITYSSRHLHQRSIIATDSFAELGCRAAPSRRRNNTALAPSLSYGNEFVRTVGHFAAPRWRAKTHHLHNTTVIAQHSSAKLGCRAAPRRRRNNTTLGPSINYSSECVRGVGMICLAAATTDSHAMCTKRGRRPASSSPGCDAF